ncbi:sulfatase-like hydrolase/transferase [Pontiellaceae bacterium B12227]|nr:sulfatase-like hydrolase/transferase [Pontiellaceae bacterium B12227]
MNKFTSKLCRGLVVAILSCLITSVDAGLTGVLDLSGRDVVGLGLGGGESNGDFASPKTFNATSDLSLNDVAWSDGGYSGVVDISFVATASDAAGGDTIRRGGKGAFGINDGGSEGPAGRAVLNPDDGTITLSNIQFTYVSGDAISNIESIQFAAVYIGNWVAGETGTLNGQAFATGDSGGDTTATGRNVLSSAADSVVVDSTSGAFSINGVDLSVSTASDPVGIITWGAATDVSAISEVVTSGTLVEAINGASGTSVLTVNTVDFSGSGGALLSGATAASSQLDSGGDTGDASYNTLLDNVDYGGGGDYGTISIGNGSLTSGDDYLIQIWYCDDVRPVGGRVMRLGDGNGNTVDLDAKGGGQGQYAIGTFTADGTSQTLSFDAIGMGNAHITAYQIREAGPAAEPDVPTGLTATNGLTDEIILDWDDNNQSGFSYFVVKRSETSGGSYTPIPGAEPTVSEYTDTGLTTGTNYYYVVSAVNADDVESTNSVEASATAQVFVPDAPTVPAGFDVRAGNTRAYLSWDENTQVGFKEFRVKRSTVSGEQYDIIATISAGADTTYNDSGLTNGTTYYYVVTAVNADDLESAPCAEQSATPAAGAEAPNFLFIIADDMDTYAVNAYRELEPCETDAAGNPYGIDTPNIDRLADEGMLFHQARLMGANKAAVCTPSRACIMTGRSTWEREVGMTAATTFPGIFNRGVRTGVADLPYATYRTCKEGNSYPLANAEFTVVNDATKRGNTDGNGSEWHGDRGVDYLEDWANNHQTNGKPFFMYLGFSHPHDERNARETPNLTGRYNCVNTIDPGSIVLDADSPPLPYNHLPITEANGIPANFPFHPFDNGHLGVRDEESAPGILKYRTEAVVRNEIGRNFACVDWIDQQIGRVLERLEDPNGDGDMSDSVADNTYIVFTADHGIAIGRHGLQGKQNLYEHTWRVPYIVKGPGIEAGTATDALIYLHETFPTFCDLAGLDIPATIDSNDGQSFRAVLEGTASTHHDVIYGLYAGGDKPGIRAVTDGRFKLMKYDVDGNGTQVAQLFDLEQNPFELLPEHGVSNLALEPAYALIRQQLEEKLMEKRIEFADPYSYLGDRTLFRFEGDLSDRLPFGHDGTASNGVSYSTEVPDAVEYVVGETNTTSLDLEQDLQQYVEVSSGTGLNFGNNPFTIEAWVKLETLPATDDLASAMPLVQKKVIGENDSELDYLFLAAAGNYGDSGTYSNMALHLGSSLIISTLAIPDTGWHYISVSLDPNSDTVRFQLDDQTDTQSTTAFGTANDGPLIIGAHYTSAGAIDSSFDGLIDELSITDGFLAEAERQPLQGYPEPLPAQLYAPTITPEGVSLSFDSSSSFLYDVESKQRLTDPEWLLEQRFVWDSGDTISVDLGGTTSTSAFYRVKTNGPYNN